MFGSVKHGVMVKTLMRVRFPNPFGRRPLPEKEKVDALQARFGFSDGYARFLLTQNGFYATKVERKRGALGHPEKIAGGGPDLAQLHRTRELREKAKELRLFRPYFFPVGSSYGGDDYVEVLQGKYKGFIGSLNHEVYAGMESFAELAESYDDFDDFDVSFRKLTPPERADFLVATEELDLMMLHAPSFEDFLAHCLFCDERPVGCVRESPNLAAAKAAAKKTRRVAARRRAK